MEIIVKGPNGAKVLSKIAYKLNSIATLNLADNDFGDEGIADIANGFKDNYSITSLNLNGNFKGGKKTQVAINSLIKMISSDCSIQCMYFISSFLIFSFTYCR